MNKKTSMMTVKVILTFLLLIPLLAIILVRFTDGTISTESSILLGYDEEAGRLQIFEKKKKPELDGIDGPYLINNKVYKVNQQNEVEEMSFTGKSVTVKVNNESLDSFSVQLADIFTPQVAEHPLPQKIVAIADMEGNFDAFAGFLQQHHVIDSGFNWKFGAGHLVLLGDFVDRGDNVIPTLWLAYRLEQQAKVGGGQVHFILGNHEIMNIQGDFNDALGKYKAFAQHIGKSKKGKSNYQIIFSKASHLGAWMRSKNAVVKLGSHLFVHGGISPDLVNMNLTLPEINQLVIENIDDAYTDIPESDQVANLIMGPAGPMWYRGLVRETKENKKVKSHELDDILAHYKVDNIIVGHCVVEDISTGFKGKVIKIDVLHGKGKHSSKTKGLLIEDNIIYEINGVGKKKPLKS